MGMYTRLHLWVEIPDDSPALPVLRHLVDGAKAPDPLPDHRFFRAPHWSCVLATSSYYHKSARSTLVHDDIIRGWNLFGDCSIKNYDGEIELFLAWLAPHLAKSQPMEFVGFIQYEEDEEPTLLYFRDGAFHARAAAVTP